jgi:GTP-binding protein HflX
MRARAARDDHIYATSALTGAGIEDLLAAITGTLQGAKLETELHLGFADGKKRAWLYAHELVDAETQIEDGFCLSVRWTARQQDAFSRL